VIKLQHQQPSLWHKGLAKDIEDLWEPWLRGVDQLLEDAALVELARERGVVQGRKMRVDTTVVDTKRIRR
jgi:hypothetical protein